VFKARGGGGRQDKANFAVALFVGQIIHGLFAEFINRARSASLANVI